jgi:hypothetical protein
MLSVTALRNSLETNAGEIYNEGRAEENELRFKVWKNDYTGLVYDSGFIIKLHCIYIKLHNQSFENKLQFLCINKPTPLCCKFHELTITMSRGHTIFSVVIYALF